MQHESRENVSAVVRMPEPEQAKMAIEYVLARRSGCGIFLIENVAIESVDEVLSSELIRVSSSEILSEYPPKVPNHSEGRILTGYTSELSTAELDKVQWWVRSTKNNNKRLEEQKPFGIIGLCESLPSPDTFGLEMAWYNSPFQGSYVFSIELTKRGVEIVEYGVGLGGNSWGRCETYSI